jgi:hypothetical protein
MKPRPVIARWVQGWYDGSNLGRRVTQTATAVALWQRC